MPPLVLLLLSRDLVLDVFSRYVVGWMVAPRESVPLAERIIQETCARQGIGREQLTIHADRGPAMTSKPVASSSPISA